jgi:hypothetical protein
MAAASVFVQLHAPTSGDTSELAMEAAFVRTQAYYQTLAVLNKSLAHVSIVRTDEDLETYIRTHRSPTAPTGIVVSHHPALRPRLVDASGSVPYGWNGADFGASITGWPSAVSHVHIGKAGGDMITDSKEQDVAELLPLFDDVSPTYPLLQKGELVVFAPAGAGSFRDTARLTSFLQALHIAGFPTARVNALTAGVCKSLLEAVSDVLHCVLFVLPNDSWLRDMASLMECIASLRTNRPVFIAAVTFCGQRLDTAGGKLCENSTVVVASHSLARSQNATFQVLMPSWLEKPLLVVDIISQAIGAIDAGTPHLAQEMIQCAGTKLGMHAVTRHTPHEQIRGKPMTLHAAVETAATAATAGTTAEEDTVAVALPIPVSKTRQSTVTSRRKRK